MPTPHARDAGLRRITRITGWVTAAAVSAVAVISVGIARASDRVATTTKATTTNPGLTNPGFNDPAITDPGINQPGSDEGPALGSTGSTGLQPPPQPPAQGLGGGQAVSGGS